MVLFTPKSIAPSNISTVIGKEVLCEQKKNGPSIRRAGFILEDKRIPRQGHEILPDGAACGYVTSGTFSPTLSKPICMGYCSVQTEKAGDYSIAIRSKEINAQKIDLPLRILGLDSQSIK